MLFYNFNSLDDFIKNELMTSIQSEQEKLNKIKDLYMSKKSNLLLLITNIISETINNIDESKSQEFYDLADSLKDSFEELNLICKLVDVLTTSLTDIISLYDHNIDNNYNEIKADLIEYNKKSDELFNKLFTFENKSTFSIISALEGLSSTTSSKMSKNKNKLKNISHNIDPLIKNIELSHEDNNTLIISEKTQKAYLPYKYEDVEKLFQKSKNKYKTMQEIVNELYVLPLNSFKSSSIARFREAYSLIRNKEHESVLKALDLGLELMFKYELNPIIIAACRNLDELDIYLDCLDSNELNEFHCFEIKFEVLPKISSISRKRKI